MNTRLALGICSLLVTLTFGVNADATPQAGAADIVARAGRYATNFIAQFSRVVAAETYEQTRERPFQFGPQRKRSLASDLLFVRAEASEAWLIFRDVLDVDGTPVREHDGLLTALNAPEASRLERAGAIARESARFSLPDWPTMNHPLLVMSFMQDAYRSRFRFSLDASGIPAVPGTVILRFEERSRPTIIRSGRDDLAAAGRLWIEPETGRVVQTHLLMPNISVWTTFARDDRLQIDVPARMTESYFDLSAKTTSRGVATYSNFRRFEIRTDAP